MDNEKNDEEIPDYFTCPITMSVMYDPVIDTDGYSFEKIAIMKWLIKNGTSPVSRKIMKVENLIENRALKSAIQTLIPKNKITIQKLDDVFKDIWISSRKSEVERKYENTCITIRSPRPLDVTHLELELFNLDSTHFSSINEEDFEGISSEDTSSDTSYNESTEEEEEEEEN